MSASAAGDCVPGRDGIPDSPLGAATCGTWATDTTDTLLRVGRDRWPLLALFAAVLVLLGIGVRTGRRIVWRRHAAHARWLQITPPVTATPAATLALWRLLATLLPASRRWAWRPARIVWEVHAGPAGMRCGLWLPPGLNPTAVTRVLHRAWPGARAEHARAPSLGTEWPAAVVTVRPSRPEWLPIADDLLPVPAHRRDDTEDDRLRAVFDGLASAGRTGGGLLQVVVARAPGRRLRVLRRATTDPSRTHTGRGRGRFLVLLADGLRALLLAVLAAPSRRPGGGLHGVRLDPHAAELARAARHKYGAAPHLLLAVRVGAAGPTPAAARAAAADIAAGFSLLSPHLVRTRHQRGAAELVTRWADGARMWLASAPEAAAVAGLPVEPAVHGLPGAASRRRPPTAEVFRLTPKPAGKVAQP